MIYLFGIKMIIILFISLVKLKIQHIASHAVIFLGQNVGSAIIRLLKYKMRTDNQRVQRFSSRKRKSYRSHHLNIMALWGMIEQLLWKDKR